MCSSAKSASRNIGTPGTPEVADNVGKSAVDHMAVLMVNHGVITWGKDIEDAYWKMENVESYLQDRLGCLPAQPAASCKA
jgi:ribulose-5-phosphate 4-epimerase/fuculose-1-phosphate aldolase